MDSPGQTSQLEADTEIDTIASIAYSLLEERKPDMYNSDSESSLSLNSPHVVMETECDLEKETMVTHVHKYRENNTTDGQHVAVEVIKEPPSYLEHIQRSQLDDQQQQQPTVKIEPGSDSMDGLRNCMFQDRWQQLQQQQQQHQQLENNNNSDNNNMAYSLGVTRGFNDIYTGE